MYLLGGISSKSATAVAGTVLGVGISGILAILFGKWTHISGYNVADIEQLTYVGQTTNIKIGELLYAGILISALGAVMDVAMSIASTINEIHFRNPLLSARELFLYVYNYSTTQIINMYSIGIELIQGIASTMGVILTIPLVSLLSAWHLKRKEIKIFSKIFQRTGRR